MERFCKGYAVNFELRFPFPLSRGGGQAGQLLHQPFVPISMVKFNTEPKIGGAGSRPKQNAGNASGLASCRAQEAGSGLQGKSCKPPAKTMKKTKNTKLRIATWNVGYSEEFGVGVGVHSGLCP